MVHLLTMTTSLYAEFSYIETTWGNFKRQSQHKNQCIIKLKN